MDSSTDPADIKAAYDSLSDEVKQGLGWKLVKQNKSWAVERAAVKAHLDSHGFLSLKDARDLQLVPSDTPSRVFVGCVINPLTKEGYTIKEQAGVLPRKAILYHTPGNSQVVTSTTHIFDKPCKAAAIIVVTKYINGFTGSISVRKEIESSKQFPFMKVSAERKRFNNLIINNLPSGCGGTSRPFVYFNEVKG